MSSLLLTLHEMGSRLCPTTDNNALQGHLSLCNKSDQHFHLALPSPMKQFKHTTGPPKIGTERWKDPALEKRVTQVPQKLTRDQSQDPKKDVDIIIRSKCSAYQPLRWLPQTPPHSQQTKSTTSCTSPASTKSKTCKPQSQSSRKNTNANPQPSSKQP
jgi:hypothetical protein